MLRIFFITNVFLFFLTINFCVFAEDKQPAITQEIPIDTLVDFSNYSSNVKQLIMKAWLLSKQNLTYLYGSSDPKNGGMDCSGTIYYLLKSVTHANVPRDANEMYEWVRKDGKTHIVTNNNFQSNDFNELKPGDLLFWSGTYDTHSKRFITHVMLYLGKNNNNEPLMFGASNGRTYHGKKMWGVSVFDFKLPNPKDKARFVAYGCIPSFTC